MLHDTCRWYISIDQPECGKPAVQKVTVQGKVTKATVPVCTQHAAEHDRSFAKIRTFKKNAS